MSIIKKLFFIASLVVTSIFFIPAISHAGIGNNLFGVAWSDNIGWISFNNCKNPNPANCTGYDYGANLTSSNVWSGYAWSDNIGWISFNPSDWSSCPPQGNCSSYTSYTNSTANTWVWGRALNGVGNLDTELGGDYYDGWIAISGSGFGPVIGNPTVFETGDLAMFNVKEIKYATDQQGNRIDGSGYAWGGNVIGWIDLSLQTIGISVFGGGNNDDPITKLYAYVPSLLLVATPQSVGSGNTSTTLTWSSPDGTSYASCVSFGGGAGWDNVSQSAVNTANPTRSKSNVTVPSNPTVFKITCTTASGVSASAETSVSIQNANPYTIHLDATPTIVNAGATTKLSWYSPTGTAFVGACTGSDGASDWNTSQSQPTTNNPTQSKTNVTVPVSPVTTFKITCPIANGGTVSDTVDVSVNSSASNLSISATPSTSVVGGKVTLTYLSPSGATYTSCNGLDGGSDWDGTSRTGLNLSNGFSQTVSNLTVPQPVAGTTSVTYGVLCTKSNGSTDTAFTSVSITSNPTDLVLTATPTTVPSGGTTKLYWYSPNGTIFTNCTASGGGSDWGGKVVTPPNYTNPNPSQSNVTVPYAKTTYTVSCTTSAGAIEVASTVVNQGAVKLVLVANPTTVTSGGTTTLYYQSPTATVFSSCVGSGGDSYWNTNLFAPNGTTAKYFGSYGVPTYPKTVFFITCKTATGNIEVASAEVTIIHTLKVNMTATPSSVLAGDSSVISWTVDHATGSTSCTAGTPTGWTTQKGASGSQQVNNITAPKTFNLNCSDSYTGATATGAVTVSILSVDSFSTNMACVDQNDSPSFNWSSTGATDCTINYYQNGWNGCVGLCQTQTPDMSFSVGTNGSNFVTNGATNGDYTLTCSNGQVSTPETSINKISISLCPPTFDALSIGCNASSPNAWDQGNGTYLFSMAMTANAKNGFTEPITFGVTWNPNLPFNILSQAVTATYPGNSAYNATLPLNIDVATYNTLPIASNGNREIEYTASGYQAGNYISSNAMIEICPNATGVGGGGPIIINPPASSTRKIPIFKPI